MSERKVPFFVTEYATRRNPERAPRHKVGVVKEAGSLYVTSKPIKDAKMVVKALWKLFEDYAQEAYYIVILDETRRISGVHMVSLGTLTASLVHPREVFKVPIALDAPYIIGVHNHPSGDPTPSFQDKDLWDRMDMAGEIVGIEILDNIIIGETTFYSHAFLGIREIPT